MNGPRLHVSGIDKSSVRNAIINSATAAVRNMAPLSLIDPRGMIFDRSPSGPLTLRVRGNGCSYVLVRPSGMKAFEGLEIGGWEAIPLPADDDLPGSVLLRNNADGLQDLVALPGPLDCSVVTHRLGRRAVLRISTVDGTRTRFVKLMSSKAYRKAERVFASLRGTAGDLVVRPSRSAERFAAFVFEEVEGASLHDALWAGDPLDLENLVRVLASFSSTRLQGVARRRDLQSERASALRALDGAELFREEFAPLQEILFGLSLPDLPGSGLLHGDLHDKQVFLDGSALRFIDADGLSCGSPVIDIINLAEHFRLRGWQGCSRGPALAAGLEEDAGLDFRDPATRMLRAVTRARLAGVYSKRPWWWDLAAQLATDATALLREFR